MSSRTRTKKPAPEQRPAGSVRVEVRRRWLGSPDVGETVTVTETPRVRSLIRSGFLKRV